MPDQIEELIREIAAKHGIAVARDDPILVLQTINNRLLQDSAAVQQAQLNQFKEELEAVSQRWQMDAKDKAERVLNAALVAGKNAMEQILHDSAHLTSVAIKAELNDSLSAIQQRTKDVYKGALLNFAASCITIFAVLLALMFLR